MYLNITRASVLAIAISLTCIQFGLLALAIGMMTRPEVKKVDVAPLTGHLTGLFWGLFYFLCQL